MSAAFAFSSTTHAASASSSATRGLFLLVCDARDLRLGTVQDDVPELLCRLLVNALDELFDDNALGVHHHQLAVREGAEVKAALLTYELAVVVRPAHVPDAKAEALILAHGVIAALMSRPRPGRDGRTTGRSCPQVCPPRLLEGLPNFVACELSPTVLQASDR